MARSDKAAAVAELTDEFRSSDGAVLTDYRGLTVHQLQELRRSLGDNASYAVVKNTLTKLAAREAGVDFFDDLLVGPTAIAFIKGDAVEAAKSLRDFARANSPLVIKGGILDGRPLTIDEIAKMADLESREVLLAKLAGAMLASLTNAVYLFNAPLSQAARLAGALQAKAEADPSILAGGSGQPAASETATDDTEVAEGPAATEAAATEGTAASDDASATEGTAATDDASVTEGTAAADDSAASRTEDTSTTEDSAADGSESPAAVEEATEG
ncbi:MAG: 50S ribosomal protein L10 [Nocardioidaceae bacterium]|nr:50S ribosomal protein L10 [Nocardioidaceae bacterium]